MAINHSGELAGEMVKQVLRDKERGRKKDRQTTEDRRTTKIGKSKEG